MCLWLQDLSHGLCWVTGWTSILVTFMWHRRKCQEQADCFLPRVLSAQAWSTISNISWLLVPVSRQRTPCLV